ncbi:WD40 repeat protein [Rhizobium leguminosarum]|uniref:NB-ARC domain-containing protein n=1 Tax=Rhizobium leguminosarum TaxID=384 RepID=UPI0016154CAD|nr:NB-ARC domain-containing protein [Rhizobium leguminosarum]MBB5663873.1 WD40 repeat protein [Rhizobium leguminosarum]
MFAFVSRNLERPARGVERSSGAGSARCRHLFLAPPQGGGRIAIQCKGKERGYGHSVTLNELKVEIAKAEKFTPTLTHWILATTASRNSVLQAEARRISDTRSEVGLFTVQILAWEDIQDLIASDSKILEEFYPEHAFDIGNLIKELQVRRGKDVETPGDAFVGLGDPPNTALPGPVYNAIPIVPPNYQPRPAELAKLKTTLLEGSFDAGVVGEVRHAGLSGMGGIGKTLLATALVNDEAVVSTFQYGIIWLTFGQHGLALDQIRLLGRAVVGRNVDYGSVDEGRADLARLLKGRRLLVVLDDIWEAKQLSAFKDITPYLRLLITTRKERLLQRVGAKLHRIDLLDAEAAKTFFLESLGETECPPESSFIIGECGGLPLALTAAASMIRRHGWQRTADAFRRYRLDAFATNWLPQEQYENLALVLAISVQLLDFRERNCFFSCAIWPEDQTVPENALPIYWGVEDDFDVPDIADALVDASVLQRVERQDSSGSSLVGYQLHDLYHDYLRHAVESSLTLLHSDFVDKCVKVDSSVKVLVDNKWVINRVTWHLKQANRRSDAIKLFFNLNWLKNRITQEGVSGLLSDMSALELNQDVARLRKVLRLSATVLNLHPNQLEGQLLGRLSSGRDGPIADLLKDCREAPGVLVPDSYRHLYPPDTILQIYVGHKAPVVDLWTLGNGKAVSRSSDGMICVWDLDSGEGKVFKESIEPLLGMYPFPDGRRLLTWSKTGVLRIRDLEADTSKSPFQAPAIRRAYVLSNELAVGWGGDSALQKLALESGATTSLEGHTGTVNGVLRMSDRQLLSWSDDGTMRMWDLDTDTSIVFKGHDAAIIGALQLPDSSVLSWSADGALLKWDLDGRSFIAFESRTDPIQGILPLPEGRALSGHPEKKLRLWDLRTGQSRLLTGRFYSILRMGVLLDGRLLCWDDPGSQLRIWHPERDEDLCLEGHTAQINTAAQLRNGNLLSTSEDRTLRVWDLAGGQCRVLTGHTKSVNTFLQTSDDGSVLSVSDDWTIRAWDVETLPESLIDRHTSPVRGLTPLSDGRALSWSEDSALRIWNENTLAGTVLEGHSARVLGATELSGRGMLSWSEDRTLRIWEKSGTLRQTLQGHSAEVVGALELTRGRVLSWSNDRTLRVWDLASGGGSQLRAHSHHIRGVSLIGDDKALSWSWDHSLRLWDLSTGENEMISGGPNIISGIQLLSEERVVSWSAERSLKIWNVRARGSQTLKGHDATVLGVHRLTNGSLLSWSEDRTLRLWDVASGDSEKLAGHSEAVRGAIQMSDTHAISWSDDATIRAWDLRRCISRCLDCNVGRILGVIKLSSNIVLVWSANKILEIWDIGNNAAAGTMILDDALTSVHFSAARNEIFFGTSNGRVRKISLSNGNPNLAEARQQELKN